MSIEGFDAEVNDGIQYINQKILTKEEKRGIEIDAPICSRCSDAGKHIAEVRITYEGNVAEQKFTSDHLLHCQPGDKTKKKAQFELAIKLTNLFLRLGK